jgi:DNA-binding NarL/FixJ family response regulator
VGVVRVLVIAPHPLLREGIRLSLADTGWDVSSEAADLRSAVTAVRDTRPDACLVDADLPGGGLTAVSEIVRAHPQAVVVVLADRYSDANLVDAVRAGAMGYLDKDIRSDRLPSVIRAALAGEAVIPRRLVGRLLTEVRDGAKAPVWDSGGARLTRREAEVLELIRTGMPTARIAERLFVSPGTVRSHVMSMVRKLNVSDRAALLLHKDLQWGQPRPASRQASLR